MNNKSENIHKYVFKPLKKTFNIELQFLAQARKGNRLNDNTASRSGEASELIMKHQVRCRGGELQHLHRDGRDNHPLGLAVGDLGHLGNASLSPVP